MKMLLLPSDVHVLTAFQHLIESFYPLNRDGQQLTRRGVVSVSALKFQSFFLC